MSANTVKPAEKINIIETFFEGSRKGWNIAINTIMPAMVLGYVLAQVFTVTGIMAVLGKICGPVMGLFGLPGEAVTVLISAFFAKGAGAATAFNLYQNGVITAAEATICVMPAMLMGTLVGHYARIVLVSETNSKYRLIMLVIPLFDAALGMLLMRLCLTLMGLI